jgi:prepilin-type N-terminal cleavage/methylation domain-containing protein
LSRAGTESILRAIGKRAREQAGFTLIEVLIVMLLLGVVMVPIGNAFVFEGNQTPNDTSYAQAIGDGTSSLQMMMQEIRQAYGIESTNGDPTTGHGSYIDFLLMIYNPVTGADNPWEVRYGCGQTSPTNSAFHACVRFACQATAINQQCALPTTFPTSASGSKSGVVIDRVLNSGGAVFTFRDKNSSPATNAQDLWTVEANVQVPASGSRTNSQGQPATYGPTHTITLDNQTSIPNLQNGT